MEFPIFRNAWHARKVVGSIYSIDDQHHHQAATPDRRLAPRKMTNGPTEAVNNLIKRVKGVAFGITNWTNYRTRSLLRAGKPDWSLLDLSSR